MIPFSVSRTADVYVALVAALAELNAASATLADGDPDAEALNLLTRGVDLLVTTYGVRVASVLRAIEPDVAVDLSPLVAWAPAQPVTNDADLPLSDLLRLRRLSESLATDAAARRDGAALERWQRVAQRYADLFDIRAAGAAFERTASGSQRARFAIDALLAPPPMASADADPADPDGDPDEDGDPADALAARWRVGIATDAPRFIGADPDPDNEFGDNGDVWFVAPEWMWYRTLVDTWRAVQIALLSVADGDAVVYDNVTLAESYIADLLARQPHYGTATATQLGVTDNPDDIPADMLANVADPDAALALALDALAEAFGVAPHDEADSVNAASVAMRWAQTALASQA